MIAEFFKILMRFCLFKVAVIADIEKAFLNIEINELDRDFLRCLWLEGFDPRQPNCLDSVKVQTLRFTRVPFGVCSSPFHLGATLNFHIEKYKETCPDTVEALKRDLYVDNLISGSDTVEGGLTLFVQAKDMLKQGGFNLRQFSTNAPELQRLVETTVYETPQSSHYLTYSEFIETSIEHPLGNLEEKVLGIVWNKEADKFVFRFERLLEFVKGVEISKRFLMRVIARVYDPLGLICPLMIPLKCTLREVCELGVSWDEKLPERYVKRILKWFREIEALESIEFPRCLANHNVKDLKASQLVAFSDASDVAFGATIFLRTETSDEIDSNLLVAKSRVAPKGQTLPRKELLGALQMSKLFEVARNVVSSVLKVNEEFYFSDSKTALCWIKNREGRFKQFVEKRATTIRETTDPSRWDHVKGIENPADITTRAINPLELKESRKWFKGPEWLCKHINEWPLHKEDFTHTEESATELIANDRKRLETSMITQENVVCPIEIERYSSLTRLLRVTAYVLRFINNCRKHAEKKVGELEAEEIQRSETFWVILTQKEFKSERKFEQVSKQLRIYEDHKGVLRAQGRLEKAKLHINRIFPIVLPDRGHFIELLVRDAHFKVMHGGVNDTMAFLRERFWVLRLRQIARRLLRKCFICRLIEGKPYSGRPFPPLPKFRVLIDDPFSTTGTDYAGPLFVKTMPMDGKTGKVYIFLFTCTSTRAIHLELVRDLGAQSCILGLRRFIGRRGAPKLIISDNAKAFKADETKRFLSDRGISWKFNLPRAPWTGGVFERMVKSTKRCLKKVILNSSLTYDELETVLVEVENIINNRPLSYIDTDTTEEIITPNHLIVGRSLPIYSNESIGLQSKVTGKLALKRRVLYRQKILRDFRKRWENDYLLNLRQNDRVTGGKQIRVAKVGDVVLIHGDGPRLNWKLGRIVELLRSQDDLCRGAVVRVSGTKNVVRRSLSCLYPLEENFEVDTLERSKDKDSQKVNIVEDNVTDFNDKTPLNETSDATSRGISRRAAAIDADFKRRLLQQK